MQSKSTTQIIIDDPEDTTGDTLNVSSADPRYRGMNRKQRRHAIAHERRAFKKRGGRS